MHYELCIMHCTLYNGAKLMKIVYSAKKRCKKQHYHGKAVIDYEIFGILA